MARARGTGSIIKKPGGGFFVGFSVRGKPHRVAVSTITGIPAKLQTKKDAQQALDSLRGKAGQFVSRTAAHHGPTVAEVLDDYLLVLKARNAAAIKTHAIRQAHFKRAFGDLPAGDLSSTMLLRWVESMKTRTPQPMKLATIDATLGALRAAFRYAATEDPPRLERLPRFPSLSYSNARQVVLEPEEFAAIRPCLPDGLRGAFELAYVIAWRKGEMLGLTWSMINRRDQIIQLPDSKSGEPRMVPISPEMRGILDEAFARQVIGCPHVFHHRGRMIKDGWALYQWHRACAQAGIEDRRFHDTRRAAVQRLIHNGTPERVAMDISGHKTTKMLHRYAIKSTASMRAALATPALPSVPVRSEGSGERLWNTGT